MGYVGSFRVGRTARAGQYGLVTSMYTESNRDLVAAVRRAGELDLPVIRERDESLKGYDRKFKIESEADGFNIDVQLFQPR
nr:uncharacterized protein LOC103449477 isoform X2 [Malus domestica]